MHVAEELGVHLVEVNTEERWHISELIRAFQVDGYTLLGDSEAKSHGAFQAALEKATECAPSIFLLRHLEAVGRKDNNPGNRKGEL